MGLAMLFSVVFRKVSTSLLTSIGIWLFFSIFIFLIAPAIANVIAPAADGSREAVMHNAEMAQMLTRLSPNTLFSEVTTALLLPVPFGSLGGITASQAARGETPKSPPARFKTWVVRQSRSLVMSAILKQPGN